MKQTLYFLFLLTWLTSLTSSCSKPTEACFLYFPTTITTDTTVVFDAACSDNASYFSWNFGESAADTTTTSLTITHKYASAGQYTVTLNAKRKDGVSLGSGQPTAMQIITVE